MEMIICRTGAAVPPDIIAAVIIALLAVVIVTVAVPVLIYAGHLKYYIRILAIVFICLFLFALISFPYTPITPKRLINQHTLHRPVQIIYRDAKRNATSYEDIQAFIAKEQPRKEETFILIGSFDYLPAEMIPPVHEPSATIPQTRKPRLQLSSHISLSGDALLNCPVYLYPAC